MIGLDTTVLLTHEIKEAAGHEALRAYIATACRSGNVLFAISPQVLQEFVHVATDPRRFKVLSAVTSKCTTCGHFKVHHL